MTKCAGEILEVGHSEEHRCPVAVICLDIANAREAGRLLYQRVSIETDPERRYDPALVPIALAAKRRAYQRLVEIARKP
jgi:hypothetical protein